MCVKKKKKKKPCLTGVIIGLLGWTEAGTDLVILHGVAVDSAEEPGAVALPVVGRQHHTLHQTPDTRNQESETRNQPRSQSHGSTLDEVFSACRDLEQQGPRAKRGEWPLPHVDVVLSGSTTHCRDTTHRTIEIKYSQLLERRQLYGGVRNWHLSAYCGTETGMRKHRWPQYATICNFAWPSDVKPVLWLK